jgi:hypothetical protein
MANHGIGRRNRDAGADLAIHTTVTGGAGGVIVEIGAIGIAVAAAVRARLAGKGVATWAADL